MLDLVTCAKTFPFIGQSVSSSLCPVFEHHSDARVCWCQRHNVKEISPLSSFLHLLPLTHLFNPYQMFLLYRWDVDDVDKRILHSLGFFWSWFVTVTVTVWKNKIRVRHASLGELRQKIKPTKKCQLDNNQKRCASCFQWDTNQMLSNKERQITIWPVVVLVGYYCYLVSDPL